MYCDHACLLDRWLVCSFVPVFLHDARCDFSKSEIQIFMKFDADVQHLCQISPGSFAEVKVKVQGQKHCTENLPLVIARLWFKISSRNLAIRQK